MFPSINLRVLSPHERSLLNEISNEDLKKVTKLVLEENVNINIRDSLERSPLMRVSFVDDKETREGMSNLLIQNGAEVNMVDLHGRSALMLACKEEGKEEMVKLLMECSRTDPNLQDEDGNTALVQAIEIENVPVVRTLLTGDHANRIDVNVENFDSKTAIVIAAKLRNKEICSLLTSTGNVDLTQVPNHLFEMLPDSGLAQRSKSTIPNEQGSLSTKDTATPPKQILTEGEQEIVKNQTADDKNKDSVSARSNDDKVTNYSETNENTFQMNSNSARGEMGNSRNKETRPSEVVMTNTNELSSVWAQSQVDTTHGNTQNPKESGKDEGKLSSDDASRGRRPSHEDTEPSNKSEPNHKKAGDTTLSEVSDRKQIQGGGHFSKEGPEGEKYVPGQRANGENGKEVYDEDKADQKDLSTNSNDKNTPASETYDENDLGSQRKSKNDGGSERSTKDDVDSGRNSTENVGDRGNVKDDGGGTRSNNDDVGSRGNSKDGIGGRRNSKDDVGGIRNNNDDVGSKRNSKLYAGNRRNSKHDVGSRRNSKVDVGNRRNSKDDVGSRRNSKDDVGTIRNVANDVANTTKSSDEVSSSTNSNDVDMGESSGRSAQSQNDKIKRNVASVKDDKDKQRSTSNTRHPQNLNEDRGPYQRSENSNEDPYERNQGTNGSLSNSKKKSSVAQGDATSTKSSGGRPSSKLSNSAASFISEPPQMVERSPGKPRGWTAPVKSVPLAANKWKKRTLEKRGVKSRRKRPLKVGDQTPYVTKSGRVIHPNSIHDTMYDEIQETRAISRMSRMELSSQGGDRNRSRTTSANQNGSNKVSRQSSHASVT